MLTSMTLPKTTWRPSNHGVLTVVIKNCDPFLKQQNTAARRQQEAILLLLKGRKLTYVLGPALAILRYMGLFSNERAPKRQIQQQQLL
jgi:hypothetical protein